MNETQVDSSRGKFTLQLWTCATKQFMCFQNIMLGRYRKCIPISKGRSIKKEEMKSPKQVQDLAGHIPLYVNLRIILFGLMPTFWAHWRGSLNHKTPGSPVPIALVKGHIAGLKREKGEGNGLEEVVYITLNMNIIHQLIILSTN